jgi:hypothetical protein
MGYPAVETPQGSIGMERLKRNLTRLLKQTEDQDDGYVEGTPAYRLSLVWEITKDVYAFSGSGDAERRLQRNVAPLVRGGR